MKINKILTCTEFGPLPPVRHFGMYRRHRTLRRVASQLEICADYRFRSLVFTRITSCLAVWRFLGETNVSIL